MYPLKNPFIAIRSGRNRPSRQRSTMRHCHTKLEAGAPDSERAKFIKRSRGTPSTQCKTLANAVHTIPICRGALTTGFFFSHWAWLHWRLTRY